MEIESKLNNLSIDKSYHIFDKSIRIKIIKAIYHDTTNIDKYSNVLEKNQLNLLKKFPKLVEIKDSQYYQSYIPYLKIWTQNRYLTLFNKIVRVSMIKYNKQNPIKLWTNIFKNTTNIDIIDTNTTLGSIYILLTDSEYYSSLEFYEEIKKKLKIFFTLEVGRLSICLKGLTTYGNQIMY